MKSKKLLFFYTLVLFLLFLKIDFRITNDLNCCGDDYDYFSHAVTIGEDFDFDYSNQLPNKSRFFRNNKDAPFGFVGTGLLSSPFILFGNILDYIFGDLGESGASFKFLLYSFSSIFYFLFALYLLKQISLHFEVNFNYLHYFLGSGIIYYVFERYSMTPIYEVFTILLIILLTINFINDQTKIKQYSLLIPLSMLLAILVRWTNLFVLLIPAIIILTSDDYKNLFKKIINKYFVMSSIASIGLFVLHSQLIYGVVTFSPSYVYMVDEFDNLVRVNLFNNFSKFVSDSFSDILVILFSQEFGLFWFNPILFFGVIAIIVGLFITKSARQKIMYFLFFLCFAMNFFIVSIWNSTASSYGYRYLSCLIPLSFILLFINKDLLRKRYIKNYLNYFSIFSIISVLFFETTIHTQLSLEPVLNSFGYEKIYSQPDYLSGLLKSFLMIESYLKIIATSFLGIYFIKFAIIVFNDEAIIDFLYSNQYSNNDLIDLVTYLSETNISYFVITILLSMFACRFVYKQLGLATT